MKKYITPNLDVIHIQINDILTLSTNTTGNPIQVNYDALDWQ